MRSKIFLFLFTLAGLFGLVSGVAAQDKNKGKELKAAVDRVDDAADVVSEVMKIAEKSIPRDLLQKANAVVVFPGALKGAFIVGGQGGKGVAVRRVGKGWSAPAFVNMAGGSVGFQVGGQKTDYILLIMNEKGLKGLLEDKFELGGEGSVAAGPVGRTTAASTNTTMDAEILTYSRTKGLFAGIALKGVVISQDHSMNMAVYSKSIKDIIGTPPLASAEAPATLQKLSETLALY
jgi:SH3 domain-containing YSC84-like protein 1